MSSKHLRQVGIGRDRNLQLATGVIRRPCGIGLFKEDIPSLPREPEIDANWRFCRINQQISLSRHAFVKVIHLLSVRGLMIFVFDLLNLYVDLLKNENFLYSRR